MRAATLSRAPPHGTLADVITFHRYELRTTDADAARAFYAKVLGHDRAVVWALHEQALARGARSHWIGYLSAPDANALAAAFVEHGATRLGPAPPSRDGGFAAVLRDAGGALVAVATAPDVSAEPSVEVLWHVLNTQDAARATERYRELCGWHSAGRVEHGEHGAFELFAWHTSGPSAGAIADVAGRPGVHPQWLYFFAVNALDTAIAAVRAAGGTVLDPVVLPDGARACVCDDPQGAAFALCERRVRA